MSRSPPGFRFSKTDGFVIALVTAATIALWPIFAEFAFLPAVVLVHFFLFCNVFRVPRRFELFWAVCFVLNVAGWVFANRFSWLAVLLTQLPITLAVIGLTLRLPSFHGVGYQWINPTALEKYTLLNSEAQNLAETNQ